MTLPALPDVVGEQVAAAGVWPLLGAAVVLLALVVWLVGRLRKSVWLSGIGPQAIVAMGGVAVSVHGLWGFATDTAKLPAVLAVAFIAVFDAAEMTLLVMLYRAADPKVGWTRELKLMHRTAWTLVAFSASMNAVHAPNWWSRPVLAAIPALATWLIELQLRAKLHNPTSPAGEDEEVGRPGPVRLVALLWQHAWAALFAALGLDARHSGSQVAKAALVQKAARRVYRLRLALDDPAAGRRARRTIARRRAAAQKALDRADVATDPAQSLALARRLAALTRADEVAQADYSDAPGILALLEDLAVTTGAERVEATGRAEAARQEAESARQRAEAARREAEAARERAEAATAAAREELARLQADRTAAAGERQEASALVADARQRAEAARRDAESARQRAEAATEVARTQQAALDRLRAQARDQQDAVSRGQAVLGELQREIQQATLLRDRLSGELADLAGGASADEPVWKSAAKQQGWEHYLTTLTTTDGATEPTAVELAERFGIDAGNARNWLRDFRTARAAQLAAHQPRGAARSRAEALA